MHGPSLRNAGSGLGLFVVDHGRPVNFLVEVQLLADGVRRSGCRLAGLRLHCVYSFDDQSDGPIVRVFALAGSETDAFRSRLRALLLG